ncbi:A-kinase anchor protein SPHKAP isoform X2 [Anguilla anguilla]|uniref:A-kinase anchor protein SPHKAP isoform X2 n=1 Tax=Anguilla anguilla TaxID=7936 RepID=UPI0015B095DA|nr:A-kinase anchor protein SPHKAP isoform X2 [Anguilla anguilla]
MAGAKCLLKMPSNFQPSAMFEISDSTDTEEVNTETAVGSSITACKKVLCSNSVLDSTEFWLQNDKTLCKIGFLEDKCEGSCTTVCFVNLDQGGLDHRDDSHIKKLASVSPDLPKLINSLNMRQSKENEILLLGGIEVSNTLPPESTHHQGQRTADVCLVQCVRGQSLTQPSSIIYQINKFLIGLESGQEQQPHGRSVGQRGEDDTNRSVSSIEEDFLTASEYLGDDSEEDPFRNDADCGDAVTEPPEEGARSSVPRGLRVRLSKRDGSEDSEVTICAASETPPGSCPFGTNPQRVSHGRQPSPLSKQESAGHYATNLAESVLQDAFIRLSQDSPSFSTEAAVSVSAGTHTEDLPNARTRSFELPKIVIVQSPDNCEGVADWPGSVSSNTTTEQDAPHQPPGFEPCPLLQPGHSPKAVELALACAANVIGTISSPQVTEQLALERKPEEEEEEAESREDSTGEDYSVSSAVCSMAQMVGAVAVVDLAGEEDESQGSYPPGETYSPSVGLLSAAQASTAITLHSDIAEGTSIQPFCTSVARVLLNEASAVLSQSGECKSISDFLKSTQYKIVEAITHQEKPSVDEIDVDDSTHMVADSIFKHALEKAMKRKELEAPGKDVPDIQGFLLESINNLLFDVLSITSKKISDISKCDKGSLVTRETEVHSKDCEAAIKPSRETLSQLQNLTALSHPENCEHQNSLLHCTGKPLSFSGKNKEESVLEEEDKTGSLCSRNDNDQQKVSLMTGTTSPIKEGPDFQFQPCKSNRSPNSTDPKYPPTELSTPIDSSASIDRLKGRAVRENESKSSVLTPQQSLSSSGPMVMSKTEEEFGSPVSCFADDLASTVVSMATELAAICLENSSGKQPWFCALKGGSGVGPEGYFLPCRPSIRRKEVQSSTVVTKKHRPPRLSEIKRKTEEQPELMERLVNRVMDESVNPDEPPDPFAAFASEVTAKIMSCTEFNVVDTSKAGQPRNRLQCERWSRGKAASYESIPEEDLDASNLAKTLGLGARLGQNLSRGSSISKQSSCESITDEFSRFMVNQMESEGRGFDLLLDYYAGKNASSILNSAVQQVVSRKNGHLNVRSTCVSKQSSTESITEEFYRFMLRDMDKENRDYSMTKTKEWSNSLLPPSPRSPFCIRQSSMPDRRSSDSRLTVNSPIKANSFDGFARNVRGDTLNIYPASSVSAAGLCKSDSCLYQRGQTDQITDMLIHETWSNSIESLMRKNKIIADPEDSEDLEGLGDSQPHVELFANRLAADIVESGKSVLGGQLEGTVERKSLPVGERRRGFKQSRPGSGKSRSSQDPLTSTWGSDSVCMTPPRVHREVPLIHIEGDQRDELTERAEKTQSHPGETVPVIPPQRSMERAPVRHSSSESEGTAVCTLGGQEELSLSAGSEESTGSWSQIAPDDDPQEETSSFIQLSEGNGNSSASSLGVADMEAFSEMPPSRLISETTEKKRSLKGSLENVDEGISGLSVGGSSSHRELLVVNCDLEPEGVDSELRATLQWIAASQLGMPVVYFRRSEERQMEKFLEVVHFVNLKSWRVRELFSAVVQYCNLQEEGGGHFVSSLFDWLLKTH